MENKGISLSQALSPIRFIGEPEQVAKLLEELARAMGEFPDLRKTVEVDAGRYKFSYAPLADIHKAIRPILSKHGIGYLQGLSDTGEHGFQLLNLVAFGHGARIETGFTFNTAICDVIDSETGEVDKGVFQLYGQELTYLRRYQVMAFFGMDSSAMEDLDSSAKPHPKNPIAPKKPRPAEGLTDASKARLRELSEQYHLSGDEIKKLCAEVLHKGPAAMTDSDAQTLIKYLEGQPAQPAQEEIHV